MSTLIVENLKGLSSGGNANKIIVPSGQTLDTSGFVPSAGHVVQTVVGSTNSHNWHFYICNYSDDLVSISTSSKIFLIVHMLIFLCRNSYNTDTWVGCLRGRQETEQL